MIRVVIIDYEDEVVLVVSKILQEYFPHTMLVGTAHSIESGILLIKSEAPDLVIWETTLLDRSGFKKIKQANLNNFFLITISENIPARFYPERVVLVGHLLKPLNEHDTLKILIQARLIIEKQLMHPDYKSKCYEKPGQSLAKIVVSSHSDIQYLLPDDIIYCTSDAGYTHLYLKNKTHLLVSKNLKSFEEKLKPHMFYRIHHAHLINLRYVIGFNKVGGSSVVLHDGTKLPVSVRKKSGLLRLLAEN